MHRTSLVSIIVHGRLLWAQPEALNSTQNIPILGAGAACAVFHDTVFSVKIHVKLSHQLAIFRENVQCNRV